MKQTFTRTPDGSQSIEDANLRVLLALKIPTFAGDPDLNDNPDEAGYVGYKDGDILVYNGTVWNHAGGVPTGGTTAQYLRGDKTWQTLNTTVVAEGSNLYFTNARVQSFSDARYLQLSGGSLTGDLQLIASPVNATSAITKSYVDNLITGITWKQEVKAATTGNITLSGTQTIDGVAMVANDRALVKNQTSAIDNGIYQVQAGAWIRPTDADSSAEIGSATVLVRNGTTNKNTQWTCTNAVDPILGTDNITFGQISGAGTYVNGTGISLTGNVFSLDLTRTASASVTGLLSSADWSVFSNKANPVDVLQLTGSGQTVSQVSKFGSLGFVDDGSGNEEVRFYNQNSTSSKFYYNALGTVDNNGDLEWRGNSLAAKHVWAQDVSVNAINGSSATYVLEAAGLRRTSDNKYAIFSGDAPTGSGVTNYLTKWLSSSTFTSSIISDDGTIATVTGDLTVTGLITGSSGVNVPDGSQYELGGFSIFGKYAGDIYTGDVFGHFPTSNYKVRTNGIDALQISYVDQLATFFGQVKATAFLTQNYDLVEGSGNLQLDKTGIGTIQYWNTAGTVVNGTVTAESGSKIIDSAYTSLDVNSTSASKGAQIAFTTASNTNSSWSIGKRDDGINGTPIGSLWFYSDGTKAWLDPSGNFNLSGDVSATGYLLNNIPHIRNVGGITLINPLSTSAINWNNFSNTANNMALDDIGNLSVGASITGASIIKSGGTSSQFLKADGSIDSNSYTSVIKGNSTTTGTATTAVTVTIGSTIPNTYTVLITPKDLLTAVNWYVSAQTTISFTITFVTALTGSINFDWVLIK